MIGSIRLLKSVGQFDNVNTGATLAFAKVTVVYAENGRGKTTLASILRSLASGSATPIMERQRLGSPDEPHVVLGFDAGAAAVFRQRAWSRTEPNIAIFDDRFVDDNICSGINIDTQHRQTAHELVIGALGVGLNRTLQTHILAVEEHNRQLRAKADAIPTARMQGMTADAFCALAPQDNLAAAIDDAEKSLAAAMESVAISSAGLLPTLYLPTMNAGEVQALLGQTLADVDAAAVARVKEHLESLGPGAEAWAAEGTQFADRDAPGGGSDCPFCAQDLASSPMISHYRSYFSEAYETLKTILTDYREEFDHIHGGDAQAGFERDVLTATVRADYWRSFSSHVPSVAIETAEIGRKWRAAREAVLSALEAKQAAPLEIAALAPEVLQAIADYNAAVAWIAVKDQELQEANAPLELIKEQAAGANPAALRTDLARLKAIEARYETAIATLCDTYIAEKAAKRASEAARDAARDALDQHRDATFPAYTNAINEYLRRFNASFRIGPVEAVNSRTGSSIAYTLVINGTTVGLTGPEGTPAFKNTLSAGDRNTLALAFFFADLDRDPNRAQKFVVIDDPMTSLDEHRQLHTLQELEKLARETAKVVVLSHSKPFLLQVWDKCRQLPKASFQISRGGTSSTLSAWNVTADMASLHDQRHQATTNYLAAGGTPQEARHVAESLRPMMEAYCRVAYPDHFSPGAMLGQFHTACNLVVGTPNQILTAADTTEFRALLDFSNRYHHDTNQAYATEVINDMELADFAGRTLSFFKRP